MNDTLFRQGWSEFFTRAGLSGRMPKPVRGKGRGNTYQLFLTAVQHPRRDVVPLLLVDSEGPVHPHHTAWQHLEEREKGWSRPEESAAKQIFLMVQVMETWFLADPVGLRKFFGADFDNKPIRDWPDLEEVHKDKVYEALQKATRKCGNPYRKGSVSFKFLAKLNPDCVEQQCSRARELLQFLRSH